MTARALDELAALLWRASGRLRAIADRVDLAGAVLLRASIRVEEAAAALRTLDAELDAAIEHRRTRP